MGAQWVKMARSNAGGATGRRTPAKTARKLEVVYAPRTGEEGRTRTGQRQIRITPSSYLFLP